MEKEKILKIISKIVQLKSYESMYSFNTFPKEGEFLVTGSINSKDIIKRVGYCVQIRKGQGIGGSHIYLLRHANGSLTAHENQDYCRLTKEQEFLARSIFKCRPEEENFDLGYTYEKIFEVGFIIENPLKRLKP